MKYEVIDNFLDEEDFDSLITLCIDKTSEQLSPALPWYYQSNISYPKSHERGKIEHNLFYMCHVFYQTAGGESVFYDYVRPLLEKLEVRSLLRIKANLYPNTHILHEHPMHVDGDFPRSGALFSLNTCDGYTKLKDGTKIDSIANRIVLFDTHEEHCSTTTTNAPARVNININY